VNVFDSDCAVVTSVDIDHTDYLGETREQIAFEKAGIFRSGKVAICADTDVPQAVTAHAENISAPLWRIGQEFSYIEQEMKQWNYRSVTGARNALPYPALRGAFQLNNASAALAALDALKERLPVSMAAVRRGLVEVQLAGRFHVIPGRPQLILDVAHNPHAARSLAQNLASLPPCAHRWAVFAMLKDKDMAGVAAALDPHIDTWLVAGIDAPRGATAGMLEQVLRQNAVHGAIQTFDNVAEALGYACKAAGENDRIAAFGSFYTVAEAMRARGLSVT
jgi:dihydrofolate synthase/folylpolyglutamate synthase